MPKILLVDDERAILHSTSLLLQQMGHHVVLASSAEEVLPLLHKERPDLLIQDVRMPGLDLRSLLVRMREDVRTAHVPVVLFSASIDLQAVASDLGVHGVIEKPFRPAELERAIEAALVTHRPTAPAAPSAGPAAAPLTPP